MPEIHIPLNMKVEDKIRFHEIPDGSIYVPSSSPSSRVLKVNEETYILLTNDNGLKCIRPISCPCKARKVLGQLTGITVETR